MSSIYDKMFQHRDIDCKESFVFEKLHQNYYWAELAEHEMTWLDMVLCHACQSAFFAPGFEEKMRKTKLASIANSAGPLTPKQLRFARLTFNMSKNEMAERLGLNPFEYLKAERVDGLQDRYKYSLLSLIRD